MKPRHQVSRAAIDMIKRFEGYRRKAVQLPSGRWMLGHGHTLTAKEGAAVSPEDAEALLLYDLIEVAHTVNEHVLTPLTQNQFDALCSFVFNIGTGNFRESAVLLRLNEGAVLQAAALMELWRKADIGGERIVVDALVRRRAAEKTLFLTPAEGWVPVPSALLPPKLDHGAMEALGLEPSNIAGIDDAIAGPIEEAPQLDGSASERAAAAVGARLQQIFPEPEAPAGPVLRLTPAPEFDLSEPQASGAEEAASEPEGPTLFDVVPPEPEAPRTLAAANEAAPARMVLEDVVGQPGSTVRHGWRTTAALALMAVAGLGLAGGSMAWGLGADVTAGGFDPQIVSWAGGLVGVSLVSFAAYLFLRGLTEDL
ncbi:MAG: lysozyme [Ignavibacteriales bacterium]